MGRINYGRYLFDRKVNSPMQTFFLFISTSEEINGLILQLIFLACFLQGILSSVYLDNSVLHGWKMIPIPFNNLNEIPRVDSFYHIAHSGLHKIVAKRGLEVKSGMGSLFLC